MLHVTEIKSDNEGENTNNSLFGFPSIFRWKPMVSDYQGIIRSLGG